MLLEGQHACTRADKAIFRSTAFRYEHFVPALVPNQHGTSNLVLDKAHVGFVLGSYRRDAALKYNSSPMSDVESDRNYANFDAGYQR